MKQLKKAGRFLCSMKFAIILLVVIVLVCTVGSVVPQGKDASWYTANYSRQAAGAVMLFGLDDVFHSWWFIVLTLFLCMNLLLCSILRFPRLFKKMKSGFHLAKRLNTWNEPPVILTEKDPKELFPKLGFRNMQTGELDVQEEHKKTYYASKNKIGIWGPWLCHLGMVIVIAGFGLGQMQKEEYTVYGVPGQTKEVGDTGYELSIDEFEVKLREDGTVDQYTSVLTMTDTYSGKSNTGEASVNHPLSVFGMKLYQNSTGWAATLDVYKDGEKMQEDLLCAGEYAFVENTDGLSVGLNAFYPDFVEDENGHPMTLSSELKNPGYLYSIYYQNQIVGMNVLTEGEKITVEDYEFIFRNPQQYTLIQVKHDPFTPLTAIGGLIILCSLILAFYVHPKELWAVKEKDGVWRVGAKSRKSGEMYIEEIKKIWDTLEKEESVRGK